MGLGGDSASRVGEEDHGGQVRVVGSDVGVPVGSFLISEILVII
jgi:hypothetical protein